MTNLLASAAIGCAFLAAAIAPAAAQTVTAAPAKPPAAASEPSTANWPVAHEGRLSGVTVRATDSDGNTHVGCHNRDTQTSEPGAC